MQTRENLRRGMHPKDAALETLKRVVAMTGEVTLRGVRLLTPFVVHNASLGAVAVSKCTTT